MKAAIDRARARVARAIAPTPKPQVSAGVQRFVAVGWMLPGIGWSVEVYDREKPSDLQAWDENQKLYPNQIIGYAAERSAFDGFATPPETET